MSSDARLERLCIVLVGTRNPLNIGAAARAMSNFGVSSLRLVNPYDPSFREARSAVGAAQVLKKSERFSTVSEAIADCSLVVGTTAATNRELQQPLKTLEHGAESIRRHLASSNTAVLFGSEKRGLSNDDLSYCHWLMRIPTRTAHASMNLGQAVAICAYELAKGDRAKPEKQRAPNASAGMEERLNQLLSACLKQSGYTKTGADAVNERKLRQMIHRFRLYEQDGQTLLGMLRQILWKLQH
jgi:TrmH family RNA methyltransferase